MPFIGEFPSTHSIFMGRDVEENVAGINEYLQNKMGDDFEEPLDVETPRSGGEEDFAELKDFLEDGTEENIGVKDHGDTDIIMEPEAELEASSSRLTDRPSTSLVNVKKPNNAQSSSRGRSRGASKKVKNTQVKGSRVSTRAKPKPDRLVRSAEMVSCRQAPDYPINTRKFMTNHP